MDTALFPLLPASLGPVALLADRLFGEPPARIHPVCLIGSLALRLESRLRKGPNNHKMFLAGMAATLLTAGMAAGAAGGLTLLAQWINAPWGGWFAAALLLYTCLAPRCLKESAMRVAHALDKQDLDSARRAVARIVGRDTTKLDCYGVTRACVESVSENLTDAVISSLFWAGVGLLLMDFPGAAALVVLHRSINVMDALWGKKNEKYIRFGTTAAVLDDTLNFVPARLSLPCIALATLTYPGLHAGESLRMGWKYRSAHTSPNSAWSEASFAGALRLKLGGTVCYDSLKVEHPWIGEGSLKATSVHIRQAVRLMWHTAIVFAIIETILLMLAG